MEKLVLSIFPGIGILDKGFEDEGFTILRGPDRLWGGDIKDFNPPAGMFEGVIGGPPCQMFSKVRHFNPNAGKKTGNLIPEFERVVAEAAPSWFLMENVKDAPLPVIFGYHVTSFLYNNRWLGEIQNREHRFSYGTRDGRRLLMEESIFMSPQKARRVCASEGRRDGPGTRIDHRGRKLETLLALQGLPETYLDNMPFTKAGAAEIVGNAVPYPLARALARAVKQAKGKSLTGG